MSLDKCNFELRLLLLVLSVTSDPAAARSKA